MGSNVEESTKLEELYRIVDQWIVDKDKENSNLLAQLQIRINNVEWINIEVLCYLFTLEDLLDLDVWDGGFLDNLFYNLIINKILNENSISSVKIQEILKQLTNSMKNQLNIEKCRLKEHINFCSLIREILSEYGNSMSDETCEQMFAYTIELIKKCDHEPLSESAWDALTLFPFHKCQSALIKLIDSSENKLHNMKQQEYDKQVCHVIYCALKNCENSLLSQETLETIIDYLFKLTEQYKEDHKANEVITKVIDTLTLFEKKCPFQLDKFKTLILKLADFPENDAAETKEANYSRHCRLCAIIKWILKDWSNLSSQNCELMFNYLVKLISPCDPEETILSESAWNVLLKFPFDKYQASLLRLIDLVENKFNREINRNGLYKLMQKLLSRHKDLLSDQTCERMWDYLVKLIETCDHEKTIDSAWDPLSQFPFERNQSLLIQVHHSFINNLKSSSQHNWIKHRNYSWLICTILNDSYIEHSSFFNHILMDLLFDYFIIFFKHCDHMPTTLWIVLLIEKLCANRLWDDEQMSSLKDKLLLGLLYDDGDGGGTLPDSVDDFDRYQVDWCVRWCVDNVMGKDKSKDFPRIKLSQDGFGARQDDKTNYMDSSNSYETLPPVSSGFAISCGVYYYEVTLVTSGEMMFGWGTREAIFEYNEDFGENEYSIGFDASRKLILHNENEFKYPLLPDCVAGDVIGCLIDCDARRFVFYYRGHVIELVGDDEGEDEVMGDFVPKEITFLKSPYYATATLSSHQQCHFNFGQSSPFKSAPEDITFTHFHETSGGDGSKYRPIENGTFFSNWFEDSQAGLFCLDEKERNKFDEKVKNVEDAIRSGQDIEDVQYWKMKNSKINYDLLELRSSIFLEQATVETHIVQYIQSIIEVMGKVIGDDMVDVMAMWIGNVIEEWIDTIRSSQENQAKLLELLYPYFQLRINSPQDATKHRYICIVLSHLIKYSESFQYDFIKHIRSDIFTYLTRTLTDTNDEWTKLFVLIAIDNLKLSEDEKNETQRNTKLKHLLSIDYHEQNVLHILKSTNKFVDYQVYLCAQLYNERKFSTTHNQVGLSASFDELSWQTPLNASDQSEELKLSLDRLSARSDWKWQSVRSTSCDIGYYEVLLLTSGPMRIGWSTKRTNLYRTEVGDDQFSIALDGYNRCVWYNQEAFPVRNMSRWRAGDIVGCRFDKKQRAFYFSLNGQSLAFDCSIYISSQPYYVAASLGTHQQCYFCLGQFKFNYLDNLSKQAFISNSSLTNAIINVNSTSTIGDVSFSAQQSTVPMSLPKEMCQILPIFNRSLNKRGHPDQDDGATIICQLCHRQVCSKRLKTDCCEHFSMLFQFENTQPQTPSITSNLPQTFEALPNPATPSTSKAVNITKQANQCQHCDQIIQSRPLQFVDCVHGKICSDCVSVMIDCPKCKRMAPNVNQSSSIECQHCDQLIETRPIQFVDCDHGKMCRDCVSIISDCPKCRRLGK